MNVLIHVFVLSTQISYEHAERRMTIIKDYACILVIVPARLAVTTGWVLPSPVGAFQVFVRWFYQDFGRRVHRDSRIDAC